MGASWGARGQNNSRQLKKEIKNRDIRTIKHAPDIISLFSFHHAANLAARPRVGAITADNILGPDGLGLGARGVLGGLQQRRIGVGRQVAPIETVGDLVPVAVGREDLLDGLGQLADRDGHGVGVVRLGLGGVDCQGLGHETALDCDVAVLLDVLEDVVLDAAWGKGGGLVRGLHEIGDEVGVVANLGGA